MSSCVFQKVGIREIIERMNLARVNFPLRMEAR